MFSRGSTRVKLECAFIASLLQLHARNNSLSYFFFFIFFLLFSTCFNKISPLARGKASPFSEKYFRPRTRKEHRNILRDATLSSFSITYLLLHSLSFFRSPRKRSARRQGRDISIVSLSSRQGHGIIHIHRVISPQRAKLEKRNPHNSSYLAKWLSVTQIDYLSRRIYLSPAGISCREKSETTQPSEWSCCYCKRNWYSMIFRRSVAIEQTRYCKSLSLLRKGKFRIYIINNTY